MGKMPGGDGKAVHQTNRDVVARIGSWISRHSGILIPIAIALLVFIIELASNSISGWIAANVDTKNVPDWFARGEPANEDLREEYQHFVMTVSRIAAPVLLGVFALFTAGLTIADSKRKDVVDELSQKIAQSKIDAEATLTAAEERLSRAETERDLAMKQAAEHRTKIADIKNHIDLGSSYEEIIKVGVFARLLAYAPLYVAQHLKFFRDEGLQIDVKIAGGDEQVAKGIRDGVYDFGICDPVFVLEKDKIKSNEKLKIVTPIAKRLDVTVVCNKNVLQEKKGKKVTIASFKKPSTTYATALRLQTDFQQLDLFADVQVVELSPRDKRFLEPTLLAGLLEDFDFVLLWNPATSWLYEDDVPGAENFGRLVCLKVPGSPAKAEHWDVKGFKNTDSDRITLDKEYLWNPNNAQKGGHKLLASALITSEFMEIHRPELCRKMFRAVSRSLVRIEGANWELEKKTPFKLREMIRSIMDDGDYLSDETLKRLVADPEASSRSIFPFIQGIHVYGSDNYARHLKNLRALWEHDEEVRHRFSIHRSQNDYEEYFASLKG